jgi:hypothetical protein
MDLPKQGVFASGRLKNKELLKAKNDLLRQARTMLLRFLNR